MTKIILHGSNGRMGQVLQQMISQTDDLTVVAGVDQHPTTSAPFPEYARIAAVQEAADVVIDFSHYSAVPALVDYCLAKKLPVVVATTGLDDVAQKALHQAAEKIPVFFSANMSLGINLLAEAIKTISGALEADFNMEIIEKHHNQKKDAPSGTALLLADAVNESLVTKKDYIYGRHGADLENKITDLGIHAVRGGTIPGEHTVLYAGPDEVIELKHTAYSRNIFANGALKAAVYLSKQPAGLYNMTNLISGK